MSYKITFRDKSEVIVPNETGEKLKAALVSNDIPEHITLAGDVYRTSLISSVTKSNIAEANRDRPVLPPGPVYNCAPYSIQRAVMVHAMRNHEVKKLKDPAYRERMRLALRKKYPNKKWCDHHAGEHACLETANA